MRRMGRRCLENDAKAYNWKGVKLYTAEWHGDSKGWKLTDPWAYRYFVVVACSLHGMLRCRHKRSLRASGEVGSCRSSGVAE